MVKHFMLLSSAVALAVSLGACGDSGTSTPSAPAPAPAPAKSPSVPATDAVAATKTVTEAVKTQADKLLTDAADYVKNNKMDVADKAIKQLEDMKPNLPPEYGPKIDQLRKTFDAAKAGGAKLPGM